MSELDVSNAEAHADSTDLERKAAKERAFETPAEMMRRIAREEIASFMLARELTDEQLAEIKRLRHSRSTVTSRSFFISAWDEYNCGNTGG